MEGMREAAADSERVLCGVRNCRGGGMGGRLEFTHFLNAKVDFTPINKG